MDSNSSNDDDEPKICTVFSSAPSNSKSIFDTIAFSMPRKEMSPEPEPVAAASLLFPSTSFAGGLSSLEPIPAMSKTGSLVSMLADDLQSGDHSASAIPPSEQPNPEPEAEIEITSEQLLPSTSQHLFYSEKLGSEDELEQTQNQSIFMEGDAVVPAPVSTSRTEESPQVYDMGTADFTGYAVQECNPEIQTFDENIHSPYPPGTWQESSSDTLTTNYSQLTQNLEIMQLQLEEEEQQSPVLPAAKSLFDDTPEIPFPVNIGFPYESPPGTVFVDPIFTPPSAPTESVAVNFEATTIPYPTMQNAFFDYTPADASYDAWIPSQETREALLAVQSGAGFPEVTSLTTPGIVHDEDFVDKVALNIGRIFGEGEASKRRILTADNVSQDDSGLRELIKLGCYRSALNLTKRLLTAYGQGYGKVGHYCKHSPHSLQLWFSRITLLVRIREFITAGNEVEPFKDLDTVDMYYEFYGDTYGPGRKGSMVPFYFRLLAAEIPQYNRKFNETTDKLTSILITVHQILENLDKGFIEDGTCAILSPEQKETSLQIWKKREIRVLYSLANASLFAKDYYNAFNVLTKLCQKDAKRLPQLKSAIARLFLQHGDLVSAQKYFQESSELRSLESESDQVDTLIDSALAAIAQSSYPEALSLYKQALILQPDNFTILNNMAVCLLYMGKVKDSLALMEDTVRHNTPQSLQENVLLNLSSIYELENTDGHKKHSLLKLISEYKGDGVNLASLKLPNLL